MRCNTGNITYTYHTHTQRKLIFASIKRNSADTYLYIKLKISIATFDNIAVLFIHVYYCIAYNSYCRRRTASHSCCDYHGASSYKQSHIHRSSNANTITVKKKQLQTTFHSIFTPVLTQAVIKQYTNTYKHYILLCKHASNSHSHL